MQNRRIKTDYHLQSNYASYGCYAPNNNNPKSSHTTSFTDTPTPPPSATSAMTPLSKWPQQQQTSSYSVVVTPKSMHETPKFLFPPSSSTITAVDSTKGFPQPGPSTMPEPKFSPREKSARAAAMTAIWNNGLPKNTKFNTLKCQHILLFARHYLVDYDQLANKHEYDRYFPNQMSRYFPKAASLRLRLKKQTSAPLESSQMVVLGFDTETEAGINQVKNLLEAETRHFLSRDVMPPNVNANRKLSQFEAKVEEIPIRSGQKTEFISHQRQFDIKTEQGSRKPTGIKTYHSFTILPKNRLSNVNVSRRYKSQDEIASENAASITPLRATFLPGTRSPDVYIVDEKIATQCPSAETATSSFKPIQIQQQQQQQQRHLPQHRTPAPDPWQPFAITTPQPQPPPMQSHPTPSYIQEIADFIPSFSSSDSYPFDLPSTSSSSSNSHPQWNSCQDVLNEIKSEAAMFEKERVSKPSKNPSVSSLDQNKPQIRGAKRRESGRTFCNGAKAIVSYFSLDGTDSSAIMTKQRRISTASPFSELNAAASAITAMP